MKDMDATTWKRMGSSIVWSPELLGPLIMTGEALPVRTVLCWMEDGFSDSPPGGGSTILVGGLQTVLETADSPEEAYTWLRENIMPLVRAVQSQWDRVGLVFGMDGPGKLFHHNEADDLVYFGRSRDRTKNIRITLGMWNGAATGEGAYKLIVPGTTEVGGYYVKWFS